MTTTDSSSATGIGDLITITDSTTTNDDFYSEPTKMGTLLTMTTSISAAEKSDKPERGPGLCSLLRWVCLVVGMLTLGGVNLKYLVANKD